uniref:30S ribosomal protein S4 n=1 Tax=Jaagichlorella roystonensis TaxID=1052852 RepID=A0A6C0M5T7_9CHLO|nr:30S ribosomal protein S4 [Jaagichlorella roystonensis]QHU78353.1 30S ribosomal protein S4 [Jaagichlorella roystonensis]
MIDNYKQIFSREQIMTTLKNTIKKNANNNNKNKSRSDSPYGQKLRESKKISLFYGGLSKKYLQKINYKNLNYPSKLSENIFIILESRLDVVLYRSGFFESIKSAKQMIRIGGIKVNNKIVVSPGFFVTPGDILSVFGKANKKGACRNIEKNARLTQKKAFFINRRYLKKNSQNIATDLKENIDFGKTFVKMKNQIFTRKEIGSRYKGSLMLLSIISFAFGYSRMLNAYKKNHRDFTTSENSQLSLSSPEVMPQHSSTIVKFTRGDALRNQAKSKIESFSSPKVIIATSTYFDKNKNYNLSEKNYPLVIEKDNGYGLCLIFINTIKNLINYKGGRSLQKNHNNQTQKPLPFFNRLTTFNNDIKVNHLFTYMLSNLVTENLSKKIDFAKNSAFTGSITANEVSSFSGTDNITLKKQVNALFMFLNYLLNLKKQYSYLPKKKTNYKKQQHGLFFKNQSLFEMKKTKALHLEVSYKSLSIVFLFPPQRVNFPFFLNPSLIYK